jgi:hypothetical protein
MARRDRSACRPAIRRAGDRAGYESTVSNHHVNLTQQENSLIGKSRPDAIGNMIADGRLRGGYRI